MDRQYISFDIKSMRQLCGTTHCETNKTHLRQLRTVQRTALIRILSAFRTVATSTLDVEAYILPIHLRLRQRAQTTFLSSWFSESPRAGTGRVIRHYLVVSGPEAGLPGLDLRKARRPGND
jgi:hypothetical protein